MFFVIHRIVRICHVLVLHYLYKKIQVNISHIVNYFLMNYIIQQTANGTSAI